MSDMNAPAQERKPKNKRERQNKRRAEEMGYIDRDFDGLRDPDTLSREELAQEYGRLCRVIMANDELGNLFELAFNDRGGQWTKEKFETALQETQWFKENNRYFREAWFAQQTGGADWETLQENARIAVQQAATAAGARDFLTPEKEAQLVEQYLFEGWGEPGRGQLLDTALAELIQQTDGEFMEGAAGDLEQTLRNLAYKSGISYNEDWYKSAAKSVQSGLSTENDWIRDIQEKSAELFPVFAKQIRGGMTPLDLASPYMRIMQEELEIPFQNISLTDPYIREALGGFSQDGEPTAMNLGDFQRKLRNDPRWENTDKAQNEITGIAARVMQMFGMMGG